MKTYGVDRPWNLVRLRSASAYNISHLSSQGIELTLCKTDILAHSDCASCQAADRE